MAASAIHVFGIRHHGPGSARSLRRALERLRPDILLVEGPPDAGDLIPLAARPGMTPPVALLLYPPDNPQQGVYYPFAEFSPEWQALQYGLAHAIPVRFIDLPLANQFSVIVSMQQSPEISETPEISEAPEISDARPADPFAWIAEAAGYSDGESWWEHFIEQRRSDQSGDVFQGVIEIVSALRAEVEKDPPLDHPYHLLREAAMRTRIRIAQAEGYDRIAVVCGAWHAPALQDPDAYPGDADLLQVLPYRPVAAAWVPWTYDRLARRSGYGAGVESPGWYEHIWAAQAALVESWMVKTAQFLRAEDLSVSPAHAIEATRLAEALAALRGRPLPGLSELSEATLAIFCFGDDAPMRLIHEKLIVGVRMGQIPEGMPSVPLQRDLAAQQKHTRLEPSASPETLDLDLRKPLLLARSQLLHRLNLLGIPWGRLQPARAAKGTFHELWQVEWKPEFAIAVIEAGIWGSTVLEAAVNKTRALAAQANGLPELTRLVEAALLANLEEVIPTLMSAIQQASAASPDMAHLMEALPPLANVLRYGNVRQTDTAMLHAVVDELAVRICVGLPPACSSLDDQAAQSMFERINRVQSALEVIQDEVHLAAWQRALEQIASQAGIHGLVRGRAGRLLFDRSQDSDAASVRMSQALSPGTPSAHAAAWVQGFLHAGGQALIHHPRLWNVIDQWVVELPEEQFTAVLPLLRRTFSAYPAPERRQIGELAKPGGRALQAGAQTQLDAARAEVALTLVRMILEA